MFFLYEPSPRRQRRTGYRSVPLPPEHTHLPNLVLFIYLLLAFF